MGTPLCAGGYPRIVRREGRIRALRLLVNKGGMAHRLRGIRAQLSPGTKGPFTASAGELITPTSSAEPKAAANTLFASLNRPPP
jgi:hypothetical protein